METLLLPKKATKTLSELLSELLGGTWILWLVAILISVKAAIFYYLTAQIFLTDPLLALFLIISAIFQKQKNKNQRYLIESFKEQLAKEEKKRNELKRERVSLYENTLNMCARATNAINTKFQKKARRKSAKN